MTFALGNRVYHYLDETDTGTIIDITEDNRIRVEFDRDADQFAEIRWPSDQIRHVKSTTHARVAHKAATQELVL